MVKRLRISISTVWWAKSLYMLSVRPPMQESCDTLRCATRNHIAPVLAVDIRPPSQRCTSWIVMDPFLRDCPLNQTVDRQRIVSVALTLSKPTSKIFDNACIEKSPSCVEHEDLAVECHKKVTFKNTIITFKIPRMPNSYYAVNQDNTCTRLELASKISSCRKSVQKSVFDWACRTKDWYCTELLFEWVYADHINTTRHVVADLVIYLYIPAFIPTQRWRATLSLSICFLQYAHIKVGMSSPPPNNSHVSRRGVVLSGGFLHE